MAALWLVGFAGPTVQAQPSGLITYSVSDPTNSLWDFSLLTNQLQSLDFTLKKVTSKATNDVAAVIYTEAFTQSGGGLLSGSGATAITLLTGLSDQSAATNEFNGTYSVSGSVTSAKGISTLRFRSTVSGKGKISGKNAQFSASTSYTVTVDAITGEVSGTKTRSGAITGSGATGSVTDNGKIGASQWTAFESEVGNGTWTLDLVVTESKGSVLKGAATVTLNSGTSYPFTFSGDYSAKNGESKLSLTGVGAGKGSSLAVALKDSVVTSISGMVSGQSVSVK